MTTASQRIEVLVSQLRQLAVPTPHDVARIVGDPLHKVKENPHFEFFASEQPGGPFAEADLRIKKDGSGKGLLVLKAAQDALVGQDELELEALGEPLHIRANPQIPPEGTVDMAYRLDGVEVRFQLLATAKTLRLLAFEWGLDS